MPPLDTATWIAAARRYTRLRRRYWQCLLGGIAVFVVFAMPLFILDEKINPVVRGVLGAVLAISFIPCWIGSLICWFALFFFRCPRCRNQFIVSWYSTWPTNRCKHCRLDLRPAAMAL